MIAWLKRWGWVIAFVLFAILVAVCTLGKVKPNIKAEVDAAKAEAKAVKLEAELGHEKAVARIEEDYAETITKLEEEQKKQATELRKDPKQLSKWLARVAAGKKV